jgi:hypothetical protein
MDYNYERNCMQCGARGYDALTGVAVLVGACVELAVAFWSRSRDV